MLAVVVLSLVFILIAIRQVGGLRIQIWQAMLGGAIAVLLLGQITLQSALAAINLDVLLFLSGMFVVGRALESSGYLSSLSYGLFRKAHSADLLLLMVLFGTGMASAFLMNDTLAVIGTPVMLHLSAKHGLRPKPLLLALCFAITIGSVPSPIGNPQNLLIAVDGVPNPFVAFFGALFLPTIVNMLACYLLLRFFYPGDFSLKGLEHEEEPLKDEKLALLSKISLGIIIALVALKVLAVSAGVGIDIRLTYLAVAAALPILLFSPSRVEILRGIDWHTLIFFAAMFVLMESVWESGFIQSLLEGADISSLEAILASSVLLSQFISNVPLVALYMPLLMQAGASTASLLALAAGSTIAGNLSILGAASNVIIIQNAEKRSGQTITFLEFARIGVPLTLINLLVFWAFLSF